MVQVHRVTAAMARGKRPVSFRTRKLSLSAPMVLPWRRGGRVGRRRTTIPEGAPASVLGPLRHARTSGLARHRLLFDFGAVTAGRWAHRSGKARGAGSQAPGDQ